MREFVIKKEIEENLTYTGEVDDKGKPDGQGLLISSGGAFHYGKFSQGKPAKNGVKALRSGKIFYGDWSDAKLDEVAKMIYKEGDIYQGQLLNKLE